MPNHVENSRAGYELLGLDRLEVWNEKHTERDVSLVTKSGHSSPHI